MIDQSVLDRIDVNIIQMRPEIRVIANQVLPIAALPNSPFAPLYTNL